MTKANTNNVKRVLTYIQQDQIISTHISYCQFHAFAIARLYMLNKTVFIQKYNNIIRSSFAMS